MEFNVGWDEMVFPAKVIYIDICKDFPIKAGGALAVEGSGGNDKCVRYDY